MVPGKNEREEAGHGHIDKGGDGAVAGQVHDDDDRAVEHAARFIHLGTPLQKILKIISDRC